MTSAQTQADDYSISGWTYAYQAKYSQAIAEYLKALQLNPSDADAHLELGNCYWRIGQKSKARDEWRLALSQNPKAGYASDPTRQQICDEAQRNLKNSSHLRKK